MWIGCLAGVEGYLEASWTTISDGVLQSEGCGNDDHRGDARRPDGNGDLTDGGRQGSDWWSGSTQQVPAFLVLLNNIADAILLLLVSTVPGMQN